MFPGILDFLFLLFFNWSFIFQGTLVSAKVAPNESSLILYYGPEFNDSKRYEFKDAADILKDPHFKKRETHLYMHGWTAKQNSQDIHAFFDNYLKRDINFLTLDWDKAAAETYLTSSLNNIEVLAPVVAKAILDMFEAGLDRKDLRIVAHSLGAQLAGKICRNVKSQSDGKIQIYRLDLLDAALPLFTGLIMPSVNKNDADFVQAIHTAAGSNGKFRPIGDVDFYPNFGSSQPGCLPSVPILPINPCSHGRSWQYWAESVGNVNGTNPKFLALPLFPHKDEEPIEMGIDCPISARGSNFLTTNGKSPFAKGESGLLRL